MFGDGQAAGSGVFEPGRTVNRRVEEPAALRRRLRVDAEPPTVDHDVVMEPAHRRQVLRVRPPAVDPSHDVMHLEPVAAVHEGQTLGVVGESGSGKTTLLNIIGVLDHPTSGRVEVAGKDIGC